jgi:hypothetical protein
MVLRIASAAACLVALLVSALAAAPKYSDWSVPANLGAVVNSSATDAAPAVSKKGTSLFFNSNRPGGSGGPDIWVSQWDEASGSWGPPANLGPIVNTAGIEASPALSRDEHWLFFHSNRAGGYGGFDLWASYREHTHDDFDWQAPINLGGLVNSAFDDTMGGYFANDGGQPQLFFASNRPGGLGGFDLYVSEEMLDGTFNLPSRVAELNSTVADPGVMVRFDGLEAFLYSTRPGVGMTDMWTATRKSVLEPWSAPVNLGALNTVAIDQRPYIASDRTTLFFASDRPGGVGGLDLYVATRARD